MYVNCTGADNSTKNCATATAASRKQVKCYKRSGADVARFTRFFNDYNWNGLMLGIDCGTLSVDQAFADFDNILHYALEQIVGYSTVAKLLEPGDGMRGVCHECVPKLWRP